MDEAQNTYREDAPSVAEREEAMEKQGTAAMERESAIMQRTAELEREFSYEGYQVVRKELFAHLRDPAIVIRRDSVTFNAACISGLEGVVYIHMMFNRELKRIVIEGCGENDKDALRWCIAKTDKRKSRKMTGRPFSELAYRVMGWDPGCRYKILGYLIQYEGKSLYVFDLTVAEEFQEKKAGRTKTAGDTVPAGAPEQKDGKEEKADTRKGYYSEDILNTFGVSVEEHREETRFKHTDAYVSVGMLTGGSKAASSDQGEPHQEDAKEAAVGTETATSWQ